MRAISSVNLIDNNIGVEQAQSLAIILKEHATLKSLCGNSGNETELDMSDKNIGAEGAIMLAPEIAGKEAILSENHINNCIRVEHDRAFVSILKEHPTLKSLCGNNGYETELDMSGKMNGAEDAIMLVAEIVDNGAISTFTFSGDDQDSEPFTMETSMVEADFAGKYLGASGAIMVAAFLPKCT
jgi:hypothetical protein